MASTFVQFRTDEALKNEATTICRKLGIDLQTYMRMCLYRLVSNNGIPFEMVLGNSNSKAITSLNEMGKISEENGNSNMTLEEINSEISESR